MEHIKELNKLVKNAPHAPGVYKMLDQEGRVIYIGKAKDLRSRLTQYFRKNYQHSTRTRKLVEKMRDINFITVDSELEAMILETNMIKQFQPKYNVIMKDDKSYVYIKITNEAFPQIKIVRQIENDNAKYIGPKTASHKVKATLKVLKKIFPFRHCGLGIELKKENPPIDGKIKHDVIVTRKVIKYPCLDYYIKRCIAPCIGACNIKQYQEIIKNVEDFLEGKPDNILKNLKQEMKDQADQKNFEKAAKTRDKILKIESILEKQKVASVEQNSSDIINYCVTHNHAYLNLFQIRNGQLIGQENFTLKAESSEDNQEDQEILEGFLKQYYELTHDIPEEILIPHEIESKKQLEEILSEKRRKKCKIKIPKAGDKNKLLEMSLNNAKIFADRSKPSWQQESELTINATKELAKILKLKEAPKRIECYDISHLSGTETVGSMVVFEKGAPKNDMYRKFRLKTVQNKPDDFKSMEEVLTRRFSKIALSIKHQDYIFKKSRKEDKEFIEKNTPLKTDEKGYQFYILEKDKKAAATIAIKEHNPKMAELNGLYVGKKERGSKIGYKLIRSAIEKTKSKRVYIICKPELKEYYLLIGFEEIKKNPEEIKERYKELSKKGPRTVLVYDKLKHKPDKSFERIPDLVIIDGGKGQLSSADKIFKQFDLKIPHISLAKRLEEIFIPGQKDSIILPKNNEGLKLLQRARDEAHRFAISYNRQLRGKKLSNK